MWQTNSNNQICPRDRQDGKEADVRLAFCSLARQSLAWSRFQGVGSTKSVDTLTGAAGFGVPQVPAWLAWKPGDNASRAPPEIELEERVSIAGISLFVCYGSWCSFFLLIACFVLYGFLYPDLAKRDASELENMGHDGHPFKSNYEAHKFFLPCPLPHLVMNGNCVATQLRTAQAVSIFSGECAVRAASRY